MAGDNVDGGAMADEDLSGMATAGNNFYSAKHYFSMQGHEFNKKGGSVKVLQ